MNENEIYKNVYLKMIYEDTASQVLSKQVIQLKPLDNPADIFLQAIEQKKYVKIQACKAIWRSDPYKEIIIQPVKLQLADRQDLFNDEFIMSTIDRNKYRNVHFYIIQEILQNGKVINYNSKYNDYPYILTLFKLPCCKDFKSPGYTIADRTTAMHELYPSLNIFYSKEQAYSKAETYYTFLQPTYLMYKGYIKADLIQKKQVLLEKEEIKREQESKYLTKITYTEIHKIQPDLSKLSQSRGYTYVYILDNKLYNSDLKQIYQPYTQSVECVKEVTTTENISTMPLKDVCKDWGFMNDMSKEEEDILFDAIVAHRKDVQDHPQNHDIHNTGSGCWKHYVCKCGFSYGVDSSD